MQRPMQKIVTACLLLLLGIGFVRYFILRPGFVIGLLVFLGLLFYLYKRPPGWLIRFSRPQPGQPTASKRRSAPTIRKPKRSSSKKQRAFRVIDGKKKNSKS